MFSFIKSKQTEFTQAVQRRIHPRQRTRLRPAKLANLNNEFICDCSIRDISDGGLRILLNQDTDLPNEFYVFDVVHRNVSEVELCWRKELDAGVQFVVPPANIRHFSNTGLQRLAQRLYAMDD
ncbi:PilZ domain-containing protein [Roseibium denhamense]|uniref:PilZ domain-containing protein n=2 Tax=Roseibium denhamense TaxID=76305 RepID=A0ABY1PF99_9HYPH|nr:PilZ domain-containing protein [Roseibium denhamense]SMP32921.1 PilZ domain-containing protein [Roseibium denhamense]